MSRTIEITVKNNFGQLIKHKFTENDDGKWSVEFAGQNTKFDNGARSEEDVIDFVKRYDKANLRKYFPMAGFHNY